LVKRVKEKRTWQRHKDLAQVQQYISGLVERARKAQAKIELATQEQVDGCQPHRLAAFAGLRQAVHGVLRPGDGFGVPAHKFAKQMTMVKAPCAT
jgi:hypothetical protein